MTIQLTAAQCVGVARRELGLPKDPAPWVQLPLPAIGASVTVRTRWHVCKYQGQRVTVIEHNAPHNEVKCRTPGGEEWWYGVESLEQ